MSKIYVLVYEKKRQGITYSANMLVSTNIDEIMDLLNTSVFKKDQNSLCKSWQEDLIEPGSSGDNYNYFKTWYSSKTDEWIIIQEWPND